MLPILRAEKVAKQYGKSRVLGTHRPVNALNGVSFAVFPQTTLALVGPSGCGKSTLGLCLAALERVTSGKIWFAGSEITAMSEGQLRGMRPSIQLVFQDPASSLNARFSAMRLVAEPLNIQQRLMSKEEKNARAGELLEQVGIPAKHAHRRPNEFSGGQRQRIAIARALALRPKVLILDEALSALDCSVQAQVVNLLLELQTSLGLTYIFITHDLAMAAHVADEIAVMDRGTVVEIAPAPKIMRSPQHELTQRLLAASSFTPARFEPAVL